MPPFPFPSTSTSIMVSKWVLAFARLGSLTVSWFPCGLFNPQHPSPRDPGCIRWATCLAGGGLERKLGALGAAGPPTCSMSCLGTAAEAANRAAEGCPSSSSRAVRAKPPIKVTLVTAESLSLR